MHLQVEHEHCQELVKELNKQLSIKNQEIEKLNFYVDTLSEALNLATKMILEIRQKNG